MTTIINTLTLFILFLSRQALSPASTEDLKTSLLEGEILKMDTLLFEIAFNQCDATAFKKIISDDAELYDDRFGLNKPNANKIKPLPESYERPQKMTRRLNCCTIEKLGDFGAIQVGEHTFFSNGIPETTGNFIHIWERNDTEWKLKRIVNYGYKSYKNHHLPGA